MYKHSIFLREAQTPKETKVVQDPTSNEEEREKLLEYFRTSIADEFLAAFQYRQGYNVASGEHKADIENEMNSHYFEELGHAEKLEERLKQIGGKTFGPDKWKEYTRAGYTEPPEDGNCLQITIDNIEGEKKAVSYYREFAEFANKIGDYGTVNLVEGILADEEKHLHEFEELRKQFVDEN